MNKFKVGDIIAWGKVREDRWQILSLHHNAIAKIVCVKASANYTLGESYPAVSLSLTDCCRVVKSKDKPHHPLTNIFK
jgi:hypothetical protein